MSVSDFNNLEPFEILLIIKEHKKNYENEHQLMYLAVRNAVGQMLSEKYKYVDAFNVVEEKEVTEEEYEEILRLAENEW